LFPKVIIIYNLIKKNDLVILRNQSLILSIYVLFCSKILKKRIIVYLQEPVDLLAENQSKNLKYVILFKIFKVIYFSPILGQKKIYSQRIFYLPFFLHESVRNHSYIKNEIITITMIGKFYERKNHKFFIDLVNILNKKIKIIPIIIGSRPQKAIDNYDEIIKYIKKLNVKNIVIYNSIDNSKVLEILNKSHFFILPSYGEPAAFSPYEAMACGNITFLNKENRIKYNFSNLNSVYEFDIDDPLNTSKKILSVAKNSNIKSKLMETRNKILYYDSLYKRYLRFMLNNAKL
jgi:glycosyltransferase involved in cell wall biosynthesis